MCCAVALAAFGASVGLLEIVRWVGGFSERLNVNVKTPVFTLPPQVEFKPADFVSEPMSDPAIEPAPEPEYEWSETGDYYIGGETPRGFKEFDSISIVTGEWNDEKSRFVAVKPSGAVYTSSEGSDSQEYEFSAININGKRISIVTRKRNGISYQFDGKFVDEKVDYNDGGTEHDTMVALKGRLTKWRGGKKIAEAKVSLYVGGC